MADTPTPSTPEKTDENLSSLKFDEQSYLMHNYRTFATQNKNVLYENFISINGQPNTLVNKLLSTGIEEFFKIEPSQLALLQPKIKLFKVNYNENNKPQQPVELLFNDYYHEFTTNDITKNTGQKGFGIGLKTFEWTDLGTNPGDTGLSYDVTLIIHANSIADLYKEQDFGIAFADLIRVPPQRFTKNHFYNDRYFRILVQLGWQDPADTIGMISPALRKAINANSISLFLTLKDHELNLQKDGSLEITANYVGGIEGKMFSTETDIFNIGEQNKEIKLQEDLIKNAEKRQVERKAENKPQNSFFSFKTFGDLGSYFAGSDDELLEKGIKNEIEERVLRRENLIKDDKIIAYRRLLKALEETNKIYFIDVDKQTIDNFQQLKNKNLNKEKLTVLLNEFRLNEKKQSPLEIQKSNENFKYITNNIEELVTEKSDDDRNKLLDNLINKFTTSSTPKQSDKVRINFVYFGDLVNIALSVLPKSEDFRFILGPMELFNSDSQEIDIINLADIPISLNLYNTWFLNKVIRRQLTSFLLRDYLKDICSELILTAVNSDPFYNLNKALKNKLSFSVFSLGSSANDPFIKNSKYGAQRLSIDNLDFDNLASMRASDNISDQKHYFMIYISGGDAFHKLNGNFNYDNSIGIYHMYYGADKGIVKNISFSRVDQQYIKEGRIANAERSKKGDIYFVEPYNAKLELEGTSVFKPGMMIYIDPVSIGISDTIPIEKQIPLGGYYTILKVFSKIESGLFETSIDASWENSGKDDLFSFSLTPTKNNPKQIDEI